MIVEPPLEPAVYVMDSDESRRLTIPSTGADGTVRGVVLLCVVPHAPLPAAFTAATRTRYAVPLVRPAMVSDVETDNPSVNVVQLEPPFDEY